MIEVVRFNDTIGTKKFKEFLSQTFTTGMLMSNDAGCPILFDGWKVKDMGTWLKYTNDEKFILEFYSQYYIVTKEPKVGVPTIKYQLLFPRNIGDFIYDMERYGIQLYWSEWVEHNLEPKDFCAKEKIKDYYAGLLGKMGKSNELL